MKYILRRFSYHYSYFSELLRDYVMYLFSVTK